MNILITSLGLFILLNVIVAWTSKATMTRDGFFVADRKSGMWSTAFSISATFLYAFGCIFASVFAYTKGWAGVTWLLIPNLIAVASVGLVGYNLLKDKKLSKGFNFTDVIKNKYDNKSLTGFFTVLYLISAVYAITANLTGVGIVANYLAPDLNYIAVLSVMSVVVLAYTIWGGLKASIRTDMVQMILLLLVAIVGTSVVVANVGGLGTVLTNWTAAKPAGLFDPSVLWIPGILLLALLSGSAMADNGLYQRIYALNDQTKVFRTFLIGGIIMIITMGGLGLMAGSIFSTDLVPGKPHLAGTMVLEQTGGVFLLVLFVVALLCASASTIDSALNSAGSIVANGLIKTNDTVRTGKIVMSALMVGSFILASMKIDLWILLTTFGLLRLTIIAPTLYTAISSKVTKLDGKFILAGIVTDIIFLTMSKTKMISLTGIQEAYAGALIPLVFIVIGKIYQKSK